MADAHLREAALLTVILRDQLGGLVLADPGLVDEAMHHRKVSPMTRTLVKAAVAAGSTSDATWAGPLTVSRPMRDAIIAAVDRVALLPKLGGIRVPTTNVTSAMQTISPTAFWVGEGQAVPVQAMGFVAASLTPRKLAADVVVTAELLRMATGDVLRLIERAGTAAIAAAWDTALLDPASAATADRPASLTNGLTPITPSGDLANQIGQVLDALSGGSPTRPVLVVSVQTGVRLAAAFGGVDGIGVPVFTTPAAGNRLIGIDADGVLYADDGGDLKVGSPDLEMSDTPANPGTSATVLISSWQRDQKAVRVERFVTWARRADSVAFLNLA